MDGIGSYEVVLTQLSVAKKYPVPIKTSFKCDIKDDSSCCIILYQVINITCQHYALLIINLTPWFKCASTGCYALLLHSPTSTPKSIAVHEDNSMNSWKLSRAITLTGLNLFRLHFSCTYCSLPTKLWGHKKTRNIENVK